MCEIPFLADGVSQEKNRGRATVGMAVPVSPRERGARVFLSEENTFHRKRMKIPILSSYILSYKKPPVFVETGGFL